MGSHRHGVLIVHSGWLAVRATHHLGAELIFAIAGRSDCLGLTDAVLASRADAEATAGADVEALAVPWRLLSDLAASAPEFGLAIQRELAREVALLRSRIIGFAFSTLEARISAFLLEIERVTRRTPGFHLTQGTIAAAVGASRPKVNRCLKAFERRGLIALPSGAAPEIRCRAALTALL